MSVDHEWATDPDIVVRTQMAISVYLNPFGELVIRQEGHLHPDEDSWVVIAPANVPKVIAAMQETMIVMPTGTVTMDPTAAVRQRRRRDRHRDNSGDVPAVTGNDTVTDRDGAHDSSPSPAHLALLAAE